MPTLVPIEPPKAGAKDIGKQALGQAKTDYDRNATKQMVANDSVRFNTPGKPSNRAKRNRERAKCPTNPLKLK